MRPLVNADYAFAFELIVSRHFFAARSEAAVLEASRRHEAE